VAGAIFAALVILLIFFLVLPKMSQVSGARDDLAAAEAETSTLESQLAALEQAESEAREGGDEQRRIDQEPIWDWASRNLSAASERLLSPTVPVRSTVGAGDSMLAGIVLRLQQGGSLPDAVRFGVAAGAATVMNPGTELCRRSEVERLYTRMAAA